MGHRKARTPHQRAKSEDVGLEGQRCPGELLDKIDSLLLRVSGVLDKIDSLLSRVSGAPVSCWECVRRALRPDHAGLD